MTTPRRSRPNMQRTGSRANRFPTQRRDLFRQNRAWTQKILRTKSRLLKIIVSTLQPLEITGDFQDFAKALDSSLPIPTKSLLRSELFKIYNQRKNTLRSNLASVDEVVLTCELWSSRPGDSYLSVSCHFVDSNGKLTSYMLQTASLLGDESATNIKKQLLAVMEAWCVREKVHSVVTAGVPQLKDVQTPWTNMPCFADTLNVVFKDLMGTRVLENVLRKCQNIVRFFKYDSEAEKRLRERQNQLKMKPDELIMYSGDRWLPWLDMLQRLNQQYKAMVLVFDERGKTDLILNENEKEKIRNLISALEPLRKATSVMKAEGFETISAILPVLKTLMDNLRAEETRRNKVARALLAKCEKEFGDINNHRLALNTFLDPRFKNQLGEQNKQRALDKIKQELTPDPGSCSDTQLRGLLDKYMAYEPTAETSNSFAWWRNTGKDKFGELSVLALKKLGVVSTAVPLERAFSCAGDQFCNRRSFIEPENLNMILFLNSNWSLTTPCSSPTTRPRPLTTTRPRAPPATGPRAPPATGPRSPPATGPRSPPATGPRPPPATRPRAPPATGPRPPPATRPRVPTATGPCGPPATGPCGPPATGPCGPPATGPRGPPATGPHGPPATRPRPLTATRPRASPATRPRASPVTRPRAPPATRPRAPPTTRPRAPPHLDPVGINIFFL